MVKSCEMNGTQSQTKSCCYEVLQSFNWNFIRELIRANLKQSRVKPMLICKALAESHFKARC